MHTNHRHYILLIFALGAITLSIFGYYFLRRSILTNALESSRVLSETNLIDERKQREQDVASIYAKSAEERAKFNSFLVSEDKIVNLIEEIEKIGTDTNVSLELSSITNEEASTKNGITSSHFKAHVEGSGSWTNIMRALILIEHMPYSISLDGVRLISSGNSSSSGTGVKGNLWQLSLNLRILTTK